MNKAAVFQQRHRQIMRSVRRWLLHQKKRRLNNKLVTFVRVGFSGRNEAFIIELSDQLRNSVLFSLCAFTNIFSYGKYSLKVALTILVSESIIALVTTSEISQPFSIFCHNVLAFESRMRKAACVVLQFFSHTFNLVEAIHSNRSTLNVNCCKLWSFFFWSRHY